MVTNPETGYSMIVRPHAAEMACHDAGWTWTNSYALTKMNTYKFYYIAGAFGLTLMGCLGNPDRSRDAATDVKREIDEHLDVLEYRLRRLQSADTNSIGRGRETLEQLRRHREALRKELDRLIATRGSATDSVELDVRIQLEDLAIRYETARLSEFATRDVFEQAVDARFEDLDRELALLEGDIFQEDLRDQFEATLARLYGFRNDVALLVAETSTASDADFPRLKSELAAALGKLDIMLAHATIQVDRAVDEKHPIRSIDKLWL